MTWHNHPNCSRFGGPGEDDQGLALAAKVFGKTMTAAQANAKGLLYFATCPDWVNGGKVLKNSHGQVFPNIYMPAELKDLQPGARVKFRYKASDGATREAIGIFLDVGPASWTKRYLDLGWPLAQALKFPGTGTVEWTTDLEGEDDMASAAPACKAALAQATARWPKRDKSSDGIMGDASHQARVSDHNQGNAWDLTHDPKHGVDCAKIILEVIKDPRCRYAIHAKRIWERSTGKWRAYTGSNPHTGHMHVSIVITKRNDTSPWRGIAKAEDKPKPPPIVADPRKGAVYRLWNKKTRRHFFTANIVEANDLQDRLDYAYEGVGFVADPAKNPVPVMRFHSKSRGHIWTADPAEITTLELDAFTADNPNGWKLDGPAWGSSLTGTMPVWRSKLGLDYLLSTNENEGPSAGYAMEGVAFKIA